MQPAAAAGVVRVAVLVLVAASLLLSGCFNEFDAASAVTVVSLDVAAPDVRSGVIGFRVLVGLDNGGDRSGPLRLELKAYDLGTQLLAGNLSREVGRLGADRTTTITLPIELPRTTGYRMEVDLHESDRLHRSATVSVTNVMALPPNVHETGLKVASLEFLVRNTTAQRTSIESKVYLTNEGAGDSRPLRLQVKAREVSTGLLSDEAWTDVAALPAEATRPVAVRLDVPTNYNYVVEAVLWDGEYLVERGTGNVQLLPTFTVPRDQEVVVTTPDLRDFVGGAGDSSDDEASEMTPGPSFVLLAAALLATLVLLRRRLA